MAAPLLAAVESPLLTAVASPLEPISCTNIKISNQYKTKKVEGKFFIDSTVRRGFDRTQRTIATPGSATD